MTVWLFRRWESSFASFYRWHYTVHTCVYTVINTHTHSCMLYIPNATFNVKARSALGTTWPWTARSTLPDCPSLPKTSLWRPQLANQVALFSHGKKHNPRLRWVYSYVRSFCSPNHVHLDLESSTIPSDRSKSELTPDNTEGKFARPRNLLDASVWMCGRITTFLLFLPAFSWMIWGLLSCDPSSTPWSQCCFKGVGCYHSHVTTRTIGVL